jgi:hypothetical protein
LRPIRKTFKDCWRPISKWPILDYAKAAKNKSSPTKSQYMLQVADISIQSVYATHGIRADEPN